MATPAILASSLTGLWVTLISGGVTLLVFFLIFLAKRLFRSGDILLESRRRAYLDVKDVHMEVKFTSIDAKSMIYRGLELCAKMPNGESVVLAKLQQEPITWDLDSSFLLFEDGVCTLILAKNKSHSLLLDYRLESAKPLEAAKYVYLRLEDEGKNEFEACIPSFPSTEKQELKLRKSKKH